jgi:hypothetical protein
MNHTKPNAIFQALSPISTNLPFKSVNSKSWQNNQRFKKVATPYGVKIVLWYKIKWKALQQGWFYFLKANRIFLSCRQQLNNSGETARMNFPQ